MSQRNSYTGVTRLVSDGAGGVWVTTSTRLQRRSATGQSLVDVTLPTSGDDDDSPSVVALAADPGGSHGVGRTGSRAAALQYHGAIERSRNK